MAQTFFSIATIILFTSAGYAKDSVDFSCLEQSGFVYDFMLAESSKIEVYNEKRQLVDTFSDVSAKISFIDTFPGETVYTIKLSNGNILAEVSFVDGEISGVGKFIDNDQLMVCIK